MRLRAERKAGQLLAQTAKNGSVPNEGSLKKKCRTRRH